MSEDVDAAVERLRGEVDWFEKHVPRPLRIVADLRLVLDALDEARRTLEGATREVGGFSTAHRWVGPWIEEEAVCVVGDPDQCDHSASGGRCDVCGAAR